MSVYVGTNAYDITSTNVNINRDVSSGLITIVIPDKTFLKAIPSVGPRTSDYNSRTINYNLKAIPKVDLSLGFAIPVATKNKDLDYKFENIDTNANNIGTNYTSYS